MSFATSNFRVKQADIVSKLVRQSSIYTTHTCIYIVHHMVLIELTQKITIERMNYTTVPIPSNIKKHLRDKVDKPMGWGLEIIQMTRTFNPFLTHQLYQKQTGDSVPYL